MTDFELSDRGDGRFALSGEMSFGNAHRILQASAAPFAAHDAIELDLAGVGKADSAGLALLLEWKAQARRREARIRFAGVPDSLTAVARISGVDELL